MNCAWKVCLSSGCVFPPLVSCTLIEPAKLDLLCHPSGTINIFWGAFINDVHFCLCFVALEPRLKSHSASPLEQVPIQHEWSCYAIVCSVEHINAKQIMALTHKDKDFSIWSCKYTYYIAFKNIYFVTDYSVGGCIWVLLKAQNDAIRLLVLSSYYDNEEVVEKMFKLKKLRMRDVDKPINQFPQHQVVNLKSGILWNAISLDLDLNAALHSFTL